MKSTDKFVLVLVASLFLLIAGCGGGGGSSSPTPMAPTVHMIMLPEKPTLPASSDYVVPEVSITEAVTIEPGEMETIGYVTFSCPSGGEACVVAQTDDGNITSTGGEATVAVSSMVTDDVEEEERLAGLRMQEYTVDVSGLPEGYDDLGDAGTFTVEPGESMTRGDTTYSCPDTAEVACVITVNEDGMATSMGGMATAMISDEADQRKMNAEAVAATETAKTKTKVIATEAAQMTDAGLGGTARTEVTDTDSDTSNDVYGLKIERDRDGTTVTITDPNAAGDDDPKFTQVEDLGGGRTMHTRTMEADDEGNVEVEVVIVSTDIEAPKGVAFAMWQAGAVPADPGPQALTVNGITGVAAVEAEGQTNNALAIAVDADNTGAANANLMFARSTTSGTLNYTFNDATTAGTDEAVHDGTYNGAEGTYRCTGTTTCTVTFNDKGMVTGNSAGWVFIPDEGATSDQPDYDYLHYGVWLKKTTDGDGAVTYNEVETFAGSSLAVSTGSEVDTVEGSASYEGKATGVYVNEEKNSVGGLVSATSGHFTADVALIAYFAQTGDNPETTPVEAGTVAPNLLNTVSGTIDNFMLSGGEANTWSVAVQATRATGANTFSGTAKGGGSGDNSDGSISGTFYGPTPVTPATNDPASATTAPGSMAGEFNSLFSNGSVAGAFGARKE